MLTRNKTRGLTMLEWLIVIAMIGIVAFAYMKLNRGGGETGDETASMEIKAGTEMETESGGVDDRY